MADNRIKNYTLGTAGVILDPHHLFPDIPAEGLTLAQNVIQDPKQGFAGAIRKRPGLARFNSAFAGGVILGGIPMPVAGFGGAPASGGGAIVGTGDSSDGSSTGTGDMTGSPGGTFDGGPVVTTPPGGSAFGGGSGGIGTIFGGARLFVTGRLGSDATVGQEGGSGWYVSSKGLADSALVRIPPGPPIAVYDFPPTAEFPGAWGTPYAVDTIGLSGLYYASAYGDQVAGVEAKTIGSGPVGNPIRNTDGANDRLVATIPVSSNPKARTDYPGVAGVIRSAITFMHQGIDGFIYVGIKDKYNGQATAGSNGRVFRMDATSGALVQWNIDNHDVSIFNGTNYVPYAANYFNGVLFVGSFFNTIDDANLGVYATNGTDTSDEGTYGSAGAGTGKAAAMSFCQYNGRLFMGTGEWKTTPGHSILWSRRPGAFTDMTGNAWTAVTTPSGGAAANGNYWPSMVVFNDALYAFYFNPGGATKVYKVVANDPGDPLSTSFTVTTALASANSVPHYLFVDDGVLYAIGASDTTATSAFVTTDGTTWTEKTGNLPAGGTASRIRPHFFGVNQS